MRHVAVGQPARNRSEDAIQRAIIRHLETRAAPNTFWFHVPNGGYRRPAEAKILKSLGVVRGTPDLCFVKDGRAYFLELKAPGRPLSPAHAIHAAVCDHLRLRAHPEVLFLHPANGGSRDIREAAHLKRMGVLAGASDLLLWHRGNSFALELKAPGGRLSEAQLEFMARFNEAGGHSACAEGVDRALAVLESWGLLRGRVVTHGQVFQELRRSVAARTRRPSSVARTRSV